ncbi:MAG: DUF2231 domain-containing protein [Bacteroidota bacterium]
MDFPGRIHPLLVHLPIGFLVLAYLLEVLSLSNRFKKLRRSVPVSVFMGVVVTIFSVISGWLLADEGGYEEDLLFRHRLFGFMTLGFSVMLLLVIAYEKQLPVPRRRPARLAVFTVLIIILTLTGHFGGSLTHGRDYLSGPDLTVADEVATSPVTASTFFEAAVAPVLNKKCVACHGNAKKKGGLRLDSPEAIRAGGKHGDILTIADGRAELINRITLSIEHEDHMPPREKEQLTNLETELIAAWVRSGASFNLSVDSLRSPVIDRWRESLPGKTTFGKPGGNWWPEEDIAPADEEQIQLLRKAGVRVSPIAAGNSWLEVVFTASSGLEQPTWDAFREIMVNVVSARFSFSGIQDAQLPVLAGAVNLRRLHLDHTAVTNTGIRSVAGLRLLRFLNLVATKAGTGLMTDLGKCEQLEELYVFGTSSPAGEISAFRSNHSGVKVDAGGYELPSLRSDSVSFLP